MADVKRTAPWGYRLYEPTMVWSSYPFRSTGRKSDTWSRTSLRIGSRKLVAVSSFPTEVSRILSSSRRLNTCSFRMQAKRFGRFCSLSNDEVDTQVHHKGEVIMRTKATKPTTLGAVCLLAEKRLPRIRWLGGYKKRDKNQRQFAGHGIARSPPSRLRSANTTDSTDDSGVRNSFRSLRAAADQHSDVRTFSAIQKQA
jgi:hypothetical protein